MFEDEIKRMLELAKMDVLVGIPQSTDHRDNDPIGNASIGYIMEYGSPIQNIPSRPFLIPTIEENKAIIDKKFKQAIDLAIDGKIDEAKIKIDQVGQIMRDKVKAKIASNIQPALSPRTISARQARGVTRTNTLVDTGSLLRSVNYVMKKKGD